MLTLAISMGTAAGLVYLVNGLGVAEGRALWVRPLIAIFVALALVRWVFDNLERAWLLSIAALVALIRTKRPVP